MDSYQNTLYSPTESLIASFKINKAQSSEFLKLEMEFQIVKDQLKRAQKTIFELEKKEAITFKYSSIISECINQLPYKYKVKIREYLNKQISQYQNQKLHSQNNNSIQQDINTLIQKLSSFSSNINLTQQQISLEKQDPLYHQTYSENKGSPSQKRLEKLQQENDMLKMKLANLEQQQQSKGSKDSTCKNSDISIPILTQIKNARDLKNDSDILNKINTLQSSNILSDYQDISKERLSSSHCKENQNMNTHSNLLLDDKAIKDTVDILSLFRKNELKTSEIINQQKFYNINSKDFSNIERAKESDYYLKSYNNLKSLNDSSLNEEPKLQTDLLQQFNKVSDSQFRDQTQEESNITDNSRAQIENYDRVKTKPRCSEQISDVTNLEDYKKFFKTIDNRDQCNNKKNVQEKQNNNNLYRKYFESFRGHTNKENKFDGNLNFLQQRSSSIDVIEINKLTSLTGKNFQNKIDQKNVPLKKHFMKNILRKQQSQELIGQEDLMKKKTSRKRLEQQNVRKKLSINEQRKKLPLGKKGLKKSSGNNKNPKKYFNGKKVSNFQDAEENQYFSRNSNISDKKLKKVLQIKKFN